MPTVVIANFCAFAAASALVGDKALRIIRNKAAILHVTEGGNVFLGLVHRLRLLPSVPEFPAALL
jgi:hypothetical protein